MTHHPDPTPFSRRDALKTGAAGMAWLLGLGHIIPAIAGELTRLAGDSPMTAARLASILQTERTEWNALLAQIPSARMEEPGVEGEWSVKQLVAHLTWYERRVVEAAGQILRTGTFTRPDRDGLSMDEWNIRLAAETVTRPLADVLTEADQVFGQLLAVLQACPEEVLNDPSQLGMPADFVPWMAVTNNSYAHYREHEPALRAWLTGTMQREA